MDAAVNANDDADAAAAAPQLNLQLENWSWRGCALLYILTIFVFYCTIIIIFFLIFVLDKLILLYVSNFAFKSMLIADFFADTESEIQSGPDK